jgi:uncharacterized protein with HEPN domain
LSREPEKRIADIILCCEKILRYTSGMSKADLIEQDLTMDADLRNIEIIGEATKHLPEDVRAKMPGVEWKRIAGMRDWLSHVYDRIDPAIVRDVVENKVPELLETLRTFRDEHFRSGVQ